MPGPNCPGKRLFQSLGGPRINSPHPSSRSRAVGESSVVLERTVSIAWGTQRLLGGVGERVGGQEAEAVGIDFVFRMCGALEEGMEMVIQGRAGGTRWRKSVGRRKEAFRADRGIKGAQDGEEPREPVPPQGRALNTSSSYKSCFSNEKSQSQRG